MSAVCPRSIGPASGQSHVVTAEDLELHNQAGGAWSVINDNVYDLEAVAAQVGRISETNVHVHYTSLCSLLKLLLFHSVCVSSHH